MPSRKRAVKSRVSATSISFSLISPSRTASGEHSLERRSATVSRNSELIVGEGEAHLGDLLPRQAEHALGDDVALDLVGAGVDRARTSENW